jgi:hypothetical protein
MNQEPEILPHAVLLQDLKAVMANGLRAIVHHPQGRTAHRVCEYYYNLAQTNASEDEKKYLPTIRKRIESGNLSEILRERVMKRSERMSLREAIVDVYSELTSSLAKNQPYF